MTDLSNDWCTNSIGILRRVSTVKSVLVDFFVSGEKYVSTFRANRDMSVFSAHKGTESSNCG